MIKETDRIDVTFDNNTGVPFYFSITNEEEIKQIMHIIFTGVFKKQSKEINDGNHTSIKIVQGEKHIVCTSRTLRVENITTTLNIPNCNTKLASLQEKQVHMAEQNDSELNCFYIKVTFKQGETICPTREIKFLVLWDILREKTDENHALNTDEIVELLALRGVNVSRKILV